MTATHIIFPALRPLFDAWLRYLETEKRVSPHTSDAYQRDITGFFTFLAEHLGHGPTQADLRDLRPADFRAFLARRRREGLTSASVARTLSAIRAFFKYLRQNDILNNQAIDAVGRPNCLNACPDRSTNKPQRGAFKRSPTLPGKVGSVTGILRS